MGLLRDCETFAKVRCELYWPGLQQRHQRAGGAQDGPRQRDGERALGQRPGAALRARGQAALRRPHPQHSRGCRGELWLVSGQWSRDLSAHLWLVEVRDNFVKTEHNDDYAYVAVSGSVISGNSGNNKVGIKVVSNK